MTDHDSVCPICHQNHEFTTETETEKIGKKLAARIILTDKSKRIIVPNYDQYRGISLLIEDDEHHDLGLH